MKTLRRLAAVLTLTVGAMLGTLGAAQPAQADVNDAAYYTTHYPGYLYDNCTATYPPPVPAPVYCVLTVTVFPDNFVYYLLR